MTMLSMAARDLFGVTITPQQDEQFARYAAELIDWNARINLTAITDPSAIVVRHFLDSLSIVRAVPMRAGLRAMDVGTGAGFPGLPLAIVYPHIHMTLNESVGKKVTFLAHIIDQLGLTNVTTLTSRAEDAGQNPAHRAQYDLVMARAVARLPALAEYLLPLAKVGGVCVAMKGRTAYEEVEAANQAIRQLGGALADVLQVALPDVNEPHYLVVIEKVAPTPPRFPRMAGTPTRKPLSGD